MPKPGKNQEAKCHRKNHASPTVYLSPEEHAEISESAAKAGVSLSKFAKLVCTGFSVPTLEHKQAVQEIIKARADLGRLGGLFKQAIAAGGDKHMLHRLLREVDAGMRKLKAAAMRIR
jgi:hypothetical protein